MAFLVRCNLLSFLITFLLIATTAYGAPTLFSVDSASTDYNSAGEPDSLPVDPKHASPGLVKSHEWAMICGHSNQKKHKRPLDGLEDLELSRQCLGPPYKYNCDSSTCYQTSDTSAASAPTDRDLRRGYLESRSIYKGTQHLR